MHGRGVPCTADVILQLLHILAVALLHRGGIDIQINKLPSQRPCEMHRGAHPKNRVERCAEHMHTHTLLDTYRHGQYQEMANAQLLKVLSKLQQHLHVIRARDGDNYYLLLVADSVKRSLKASA